MKRLLLLFCGAFALAATLGACASRPAADSLRATAPMRIDAVATLATNACEAAVAAELTATEVAVRQATARVRSGSLAPERAQRVADAARTVRAELAAACAASKTTPDAAALQRARAAQGAIAQVLTGG